MKKILLGLVALAIPAAALASAGASSVTITAKPTAVKYSYRTALTGTVANAKSGSHVSILSRTCGTSDYKPLTTVTTGTGGTYRVLVTPINRTSFEAKVKNASSSPVTVFVHPRTTLAKLSSHKYKTKIFADRSFAGKTAVFQRFTNGHWVKVRNVVLKYIRAATKPTIVSGRVFRSSISAGKRVRILLGYGQTKVCYMNGLSHTRTS